MNKYLFLFLSLWLSVFAEHQMPPSSPPPTPDQIQAEIDEEEATFQRALNIFNPWYTGPLITPGASMMPPGSVNIQPYLFVTDNYASFDSDRHSVSLPSDLVQIKGSVGVLTGVTDNFDINLGLEVVNNRQQGRSRTGYGDTSLEGGLLILSQTPYIPQVKCTINQSFPTGKFKNLSTNGLNLDAFGSGAYSTQVGVIISKVLFWATKHPMNTRLFVGYERSTAVDVSGFHAYGGGFGCNGTVYPGDTLSIDFGYELSLTQHWVFAIDFVYEATNRTPFFGTAGTLANGLPASNGSPSNDNLSLSPAIEYNFSPKLGLIAGAWFSVYGRNSSNFASGVISLTMVLP